MVTAEGAFRFEREGEWVMEHFRLETPRGSLFLPTRARWKGGPGRPVSGHRYRIVGTIHCTRFNKNPSIRDDGLFVFHRPEILFSSQSILTDRDNGEEGSFATASFLKSQFEKYPALASLVLAVWCAELSGLPPRLYELYREVGLLPILALSGQHVLILSRLLVLMMLPLAWAVFRMSVRGRCQWEKWQTAIPLLAGAALYFSAPGVESVYRTMAMLVAATWLRARCVHTSALQISLTAFGIILIWTPHQLLSIGFMLSAIFTSITLRLLVTDNMRALGRTMVGDLLLLSACSIPVTMFFFAKIALLAPLAQLTLGVLWEFLWIPLGFLLPLLKLLLPSEAAGLFAVIEIVWEQFLALQLRYLEGTAAAFITTPRLNWVEFAVLEWLILRVALVLRGGVCWEKSFRGWGKELSWREWKRRRDRIG